MPPRTQDKVSIWQVTRSFLMPLISPNGTVGAREFKTAGTRLKALESKPPGYLGHCWASRTPEASRTALEAKERAERRGHWGREQRARCPYHRGSEGPI